MSDEVTSDAWVDPPTTWQGLFSRLAEFDIPDDFLVDREQPPAQERDWGKLFGEPWPAPPRGPCDGEDDRA